jgi:hypothetical protein
MPSSEQRLAEAAERIAKALEFFQGVHPDYRPLPNEKPLPSSPQMRAIEDAKLKVLADAEAAKLKGEADAADQAVVKTEGERETAEGVAKTAHENSDLANKKVVDAEAASASAAELSKLRIDAKDCADAVIKAEADLGAKTEAARAAKVKADMAHKAAGMKVGEMKSPSMVPPKALPDLQASGLAAKP